MKDDTIKRAVQLANQFIRVAEKPEKLQSWNVVERKHVEVLGRSGKLNASIKRASMDLTRALADMRGNK